MRTSFNSTMATPQFGLDFFKKKPLVTYHVAKGPDAGQPIPHLNNQPGMNPLLKWALILGSPFLAGILVDHSCKNTSHATKTGEQKAQIEQLTHNLDSVVTDNKAYRGLLATSNAGLNELQHLLTNPQDFDNNPATPDQPLLVALDNTAKNLSLTAPAYAYNNHAVGTEGPAIAEVNNAVGTVKKAVTRLLGITNSKPLPTQDGELIEAVGGTPPKATKAKKKKKKTD
jgi:hypothetical protein